MTVIYDGTFEGFLSAVFDVYEYKLASVHMTTKDRFQGDVFDNIHKSFYNQEKSLRVWKGLGSKISAVALSQIYKAFLSEENGIENCLLKYIQYAFSKKQTIENDYSSPAVLKVVQTAKKVYREQHRMEAYIRFQLTADNLFYAVCQPDFNVLPLLQKHFKDRYADQRWLIYDNTRKYGIYYDLSKVETVQLNFNESTDNGKNIEIILNENEMLYQQLWQQFFNSVNIKARKNLKLHIQQMPKRYWKYLPEKRP